MCFTAPFDPNSYANAHQIAITTVHLSLETDFFNHILIGSVTHKCTVVEAGVKELVLVTIWARSIFYAKPLGDVSLSSFALIVNAVVALMQFFLGQDTKNLLIEKTLVNDSQVAYVLGDIDACYGAPLRIPLNEGLQVGDQVSVQVFYRTSKDGCLAAQWLEPRYFVQALDFFFPRQYLF
ncbi:hypothetical protein BDR26DRAFT_155503 [Obelidium mucronatum]|nr:hypothetical protein BDR26DRAFT_155503 [Obelidium mucronatum]